MMIDIRLTVKQRNRGVCRRRAAVIDQRTTAGTDNEHVPLQLERPNREQAKPPGIARPVSAVVVIEL